jgi:hypothetical protein
MNKNLKIEYCVMCFLIIFLFSGCAGSLFKKYGRITPDGTVTNVFEIYKSNPNYNYYISGSDNYPRAIIGLDNALTLEPDFWKKVEMTAEKLRELVDGMNSNGMGSRRRAGLNGFTMFDENGKQIGVWYSTPEAVTSLRMKDDHTVIIFTPDSTTSFLPRDN